MEFRYFHAPEIDMSGLLLGLHICSLCGQQRQCFSLDRANASRLSDAERKGKNWLR